MPPAQPFRAYGGGWRRRFRAWDASRPGLRHRSANRQLGRLAPSPLDLADGEVKGKRFELDNRVGLRAQLQMITMMLLTRA
jgi:hypothetical protein